MELPERYRWVIGADAGVQNAMGRSRVLVVGIEDDRVILGIGTIDNETGPVIDTPGWVTMPDEIAERLGYYLHSAAEENRQQREV